jgi:hypothetical protein
MAGQTWTVTIVAGTPNIFIPDVYNPNPDPEPPTSSQPLLASNGDVVSWDNETEEEHDLALTDVTYQVLTPVASLVGPIAAGKPSDQFYLTQTADASPTPPATVVFPVTIYYACTVTGHENERGTIQLTA